VTGGRSVRWSFCSPEPGSRRCPFEGCHSRCPEACPPFTVRDTGPATGLGHRFMRLQPLRRTSRHNRDSRRCLGFRLRIEVRFEAHQGNKPGPNQATTEVGTSKPSTFDRPRNAMQFGLLTRIFGFFAGSSYFTCSKPCSHARTAIASRRKTTTKSGRTAAATRYRRPVSQRCIGSKPQMQPIVPPE